MKVVWYGPWFGTLDSRYCEILERGGWEMKLVTTGRHLDSGFQTFRNTSIIPASSTKYQKLRALRETVKQIADHNPDLVLLDMPTTLGDILVGLIVSLRRRTILLIHDAIPHDLAHEARPLIQILQRLLTASSRALLTFSETSMSQLLKLHPKKQVFSTFLLPSAAISELAHTAAHKKDFAMVGRWSSYKGFDIGLKFWEKFQKINMCEDNLDLWCSGLTAKIPVPQGVTWMSFQQFDWNDLLSALPQYKAVLLPYRSASQSDVQMLAWASGTVCIVSATGGLVEYQPSALEPIDIDDDASWHSALLRLSEPQEAELLGADGRTETARFRDEGAIFEHFHNLWINTGRKRKRM